MKAAIQKRRSWRWCVAAACVVSIGTRVAALPYADPELAISARPAIRPGDVVRLDVSCACTASGRRGTARAFGHEITLVPLPNGSGWSGLVGVDVETAPGIYPVSVLVESVAAQPLTATHALHVVSRQFPTRRLRVAPSYVEPSPADIERLVADDRRLDALFEKATWRDRVGPFQAPVPSTPRDTFGARSIFNGQPRSPHAGVDFGSPAGTPVAAPAAGTVVLADDLFFTGRTVVVDHGLGLYSVLAHLSVVSVADGEVVERGDVVGEVGSTGRATGPHLHWSTRLNGARVDPMSVIELLGAER